MASFQPNTNPYALLEGGNYLWKGPGCKDRLALVMMIKNEEQNIALSFNSVKDLCSTFIILDTGSTDSTIDVVQEYCAEFSITLHLKCLPFVDFEKSRNDLLDFADEVLLGHHYFLLLLDCNDVLRNSINLKDLVEEGPKESNYTGFSLKQEWLVGGELSTYYNIRLVISHFGWRYQGVVHEALVKHAQNNKMARCFSIVLYQDRTDEDDKTRKRFLRDKELLYGSYLKNPNNPRTLFYLAQTCGCLGQFQEAYEYYLLRTRRKNEIFVEEVYQSFLRLGDITKHLNHPWESTMSWYLKAYQLVHRVEPLVRISEHYKETKDWPTAYMFAQQACIHTYPHHHVLMVDKINYLYTRWSLLASIAFRVNRYDEGREACLRALKWPEHSLEDNKNLQEYSKKYVNEESMYCMLGSDGVFPPIDASFSEFKEEDTK
jgi:glycosyltransferase involved in cell wall biosynthesis